MIAIQSKLEDEVDLALFAFEQYQVSRDTQDWLSLKLRPLDLTTGEYKRVVDLGLTDVPEALRMFQVRFLERRPSPWTSRN